MRLSDELAGKAFASERQFMNWVNNRLEEESSEDEDDGVDSGEKNLENDEDDNALMQNALSTFRHENKYKRLLSELAGDLASGNCCARWGFFTNKQKSIVMESVCNVATSSLVTELLNSDDPLRLFCREVTSSELAAKRRTLLIWSFSWMRIKEKFCQAKKTIAFDDVVQDKNRVPVDD